MRPSDHFVQLYEHDESLVDAVSGFVAAGLANGETCVVIATADHRASIESALRDCGVDLATTRTEGRYVSLDAGATLEALMSGGTPSPRLFRETIAPVIEGAAQSGSRVRAFGEMVDILWSRDQRAAAIRLEELWNELAADHTFCLFCAYSMDAMGAADAAAPFADICSCHTHVIPSESYGAIVTPDDRLREIAALQQKARTLEAEIARSKRIEEELFQREQELSDFFENALEGIHKVGPDGTILWANRAEMDLLGYAPGAYIGHNIAEFHADADAIADMLARLSRGETLYNYPARLRCQDGSIKHVLVHSNAQFKNGEFLYTRCFTRDVTDRKLMEDALQDRMRQIEALNERLKRAMTETHHRVKNNLQVVSALIEMEAEERGEDADGGARFAGDLGRLHAHIRALAVVHDVLTHTIHENEDAQFISAKAVLDKLLPILRQTAWKQSIRFDVAEVDLPSKECVSLALVINELVSNALKHGRSAAEVTLSAGPDVATLEVCDDGPGFPAGFNPVAAANMGLELVEWLARTDLSGTIRYENRPDGGAKVRLTFPLPRPQRCTRQNGDDTGL